MFRILAAGCAVMLALGAQAKVETAVSTPEQREELAVTAYNNGLGLIREVRELYLPQGEFDLRFEGVAQQVRPETVSLRSTAEEGSLVVYEQNYEYDLISPEKLMEKYVGKDVRLINKSEDYTFYEQPATLLSTNGGPVYEIDGDIYLGHPGNVVLPDIPENLVARSSLIWRLGNRLQDQRIELSYLTNGISWNADYVVTIPRNAQQLELDGWVTLNNQSGAAYEDARLKLVAGDVNVVREVLAEEKLRFARGAEADMAMPMPQEEAFAEYHLYTMPRPTTIKENQTKQLALLQASGVDFTKRYEYRGQMHFYSQPMPPTEPDHVEVYLKFENEEENGMGMPLPAGVMRIYEEDSSGALQFAGEDRIEHTPKDETVTLRMGTAFDVVAERTQTDYRRLSDRVHEAAFEISVRNHKEQAVTVHVVEPMPADWEILQASHKFEKKDAHTAVFPLDVPADGETVLEYRVRVQY